ncbi:MAG: hypothetical protein LBU74_07740 [Methanobacteriaceae archaeon]|jgi:uncharacterized UPF0146 family protein|nr:hypothetical protein [Candidatus Methanorudis spinitermitis]
MWNDLGEYIDRLCDNKSKNPSKVVEIAIGKFFIVSSYLQRCENIDLLMTDISPANDRIIKDDITNPNLNLYENTQIIYSIRPPSELQPYLGNLTDKTGAILIIKPLFNEDLNINKKMKLINYKQATFYQYLP